MFAGIFVILLAPETRAASGVNRQINYQAKLLDASGLPVADGNYSIKFSLYDSLSGGTRLWTATGTVGTPTALTVAVQNGLFSRLLGDTTGGAGSQNPLDSTIDWNSDSLYLGVTVGSDSEMSPRKRLGAVPYALNAENLQGMYASSSVFGTSNLFTIHQASNTAATGTRTALQIKSKGTSSANDFLLRGLDDSDSVVISINRQGNVTSTGYIAVTGAGTSTFSGSLSIAGNVSSTNLQVAGQRVCLADGTNCSQGADTNWTYNGTGDFARNATATTDLVIGSTATNTAPFFFNLTGASASSNRLIIGGTQNADVVIGSTTSSGMNSLFQLNGDDLFVGGNIGSASSVYTNGSFVAGSGSTYFGNGLINKNDGNLTINASGGFITPSADLGVTLGSAALRYHGYFGNTTSTNATTTSLGVSTHFSVGTSNNIGGTVYGAAIGNSNTLSGSGLLAVGSNNTVSQGIGIGIFNTVSESGYNLALGYQNTVDGSSGAAAGAYAFGAANQSSGQHTVAIGAGVTVRGGGGLGAVGIGLGGTVNANGSMGLFLGGTNTTLITNNTLAIAGGDVVIGSATSSLGPFNFDVTGVAASSNRLTVGPDYNADLVIGSTTGSTSLEAAGFVLDGNDLYVEGALGTTGGMYTLGSVLVSSGVGSTTYGPVGIQASANLILDAASGSIRPLGDATDSLGSSALRYNGYFANVTSTNLVIAGDITASSAPATSTIATSLANASVSGTADFMDVVIGGQGLPVIVHRDDTTDTLNIHVCSNQNCDAASSSSTLAAMSDTGAGPSVAIAPDGFPVIAYYDAGNVKYIHCLNYDCTSKEGPNTLATLTASSTSIAIGVDGYPIIAYRGGAGDNLFVYHCVSLSCGDASSTETNVDTGGWHAKIAIRPNGLPVIAHYDMTGLKFRMTSCSNVACTSVSSVDIANVAAGSGFTSMVIGRDGIPTVLYYDDGVGANDGQLEMMRCTDVHCTAFGSTFNVRTGMDNFAAGHGPWNDMVLGSDGFPIIAFEEDINGGDVDPFIIHCRANDCSSVSTVLNFDADGDHYSMGVALVLRTDGVPLAFYHADAIDSAVRGYSCAFNLCALDGKFTGSSIGSVGKYFYRMYSREMYAQQAYLSGFDLAESYPTTDFTLEAGDVLAFDSTNKGNVVRANASSSSILIGAVSTKPGLLLTDWNSAAKTVPVALTGRVPVKVSMQNGPIKIGDLLALSSTPGIATKAKGPGMVLGRALEDADTDGKIEVFIKVGFDVGEFLAQGLSETSLHGNVALAPQGSAHASSTTFDSWGLSFRGSAWNGAETTTPTFTLKTSVVNATSSEFTIQNGTTTLLALDQGGHVRIAGDLSVAGKIYPANRNGAQSETYLFVDDSQGASSTYISTNAAGWQSDTSYDFAERYYSPDKLEPGDIVVISQRENLHVQRAMVEKEMVAGIVSTKPGFVAGRPATSTYPIALIGRVPTKVSTMKGSIKPGDLLAPSTIPGVAMKAIEAGPVVGQALEGYDAQDVGKIEVFVQPLWWGGLDGEDPRIKNQEPSEETTTSTGEVPARITQYQGFALVEAGATKVHVSYPSLLAYPNVQATPRGEVEGGWWTDYYTDVGFDIIFKQPQTHDVTFAWRVEATDTNARVYVSDGTHATMDPTS
ncbi:hypothetical protein FJZ48_01380, partial [Candidatus Uhrbacteria bacterium]|nr:hypothetical protein [Candidatus Uhrbacteria bacterium]